MDLPEDREARFFPLLEEHFERIGLVPMRFCARPLDTPLDLSPGQSPRPSILSVRPLDLPPGQSPSSALPGVLCVCAEFVPPPPSCLNLFSLLVWVGKGF